MSDEELENQDTGVTDPDAGGGQQDQGVDNNDEPITKEAFIAMRQDMQSKIAELNDKNTLYRTQLQVLQQGAGQQQPTAPEAQDPLHGLEDDDVPTAGQIRQLFNQFATQIRGTLGELQTASANNDYAEVMKTHLPNYLQANPDMIPVLRALPPDQRPALAYKLVKQAQAQSQAAVKSDPDLAALDVQRITVNKAKPQPGGKGNSSPLAKAQLYESMSDEDLEKTLARVKSGIG